MRKLSGVTAVAGVLVLAPAVAFGQGRDGGMATPPRHEFGVDLSAMYYQVGSGCNTNCSHFTLTTPVDVRVGFLTSGPLSVEPRLGLMYVTGGGGHLLQFSPGLNVLYALGARSGPDNPRGPYLTAGASLQLVDEGSGGSSNTETQLSVNAGIGTRRAWGPAAFRPEAFVRYNFENKDKGIAALFAIGVRIGLSFFH